jgi:uncharacterized Zn finger protein
MNDPGGVTMKCPNCQNRNFYVYEARGFTSKESPIKECDCGHVWRVIPLGGDNRRIDTIMQGRAVQFQNQGLLIYS